TFTTYSDFASYLAGRKCSTCSTSFIQSSTDVDVLFKGWLSGKTPITPRITCRKCTQITCIACPGSSTTTEKDVEGSKVGWCCSRGRLFVIWVLLCGFDAQYSAAKRAESQSARKNCGRRIAAGSGVGYDGFDLESLFQGSGMFGRANGVKKGDAGRDRAESAEAKSDEFYRMVFSLLGVLLPSPDDGTAFDVSPPEAVVDMLLHSRVLGKAAELLRNDSLDNATKRKGLYSALLAFLRTIGAHGGVAGRAMFAERSVREENLLTLSFSGGGGSSGERASSLADGLRKLNIQSNMMLKGAQNNKHEFQNQHAADMLWLCRQISDLSGYLLGGEGLKDILPTYYYAREARGLRQSPFGRIPRLITEITSLMTGLSAGIFVKHGSDRLDIMKYSSNPYNIVCLSLLGTFSGEPWHPGQSTILQVLVSIQAMILCADPLNNEPGIGMDRSSIESYTKMVRGLTTKYAVLAWAKSPPTLWADVVNSHFRKKADRILQTVDQWAQ
ncbi:hypothetical protein P153DRAFT_275574, partial [Dothidotthia symphoricarpi CBS 119687]